MCAPDNRVRLCAEFETRPFGVLLADSAARKQFRQKHTRGKKKLIGKWVSCIKENGPDELYLSEVHLTDVTHKSIDDLPSDSMHQKPSSGYVPLLLLISCWSAEPWPPHRLGFPLKMSPQPENELLIVVPVGRASLYNVCTQIYAPTVERRQTDTYLLAAEEKQLYWDGAALLLPLHLFLIVFLWDSFYFLHFFTCILLCQTWHLQSSEHCFLEL